MPTHSHEEIVAKIREADSLFADKLASDGDCIVWEGAKHTFGYGLITRRVNGKRKVLGTHRASWAIFHGNIRRGQCVCHKCDNPPCVNPLHLFVGTAKDNVRDMMRKNRQRHANGETHYRTSLTKDDVLAIRWMRSRGVSPVLIGEQFGIARQTVSDIVAKRTWARVPDKPEGWQPPNIEGELVLQGWVR